VPTVQIKVPTLISIFMIIPLNYYSTWMTSIALEQI
jgi:hypothetical protein